MYRAITPVLALALTLVSGPGSEAGVYLETTAGTTRPAKTYQTFTEAEKNAYVERAALKAGEQLAGGKSIVITPDAIRLIRRDLDVYAARIDATSKRDPLSAVFGRGRASIPTIKRAFEAEALAPVTGIYIAMIESEFHDCLESRMGAKGMFQFLPKTAEKYGVSAADLCDLEKSAPAAARYIKDRRGEYGTDALGSVLAVLSYNAGTRNVEQALTQVSGSGAKREASFWSLLATPYGRGLPDYFANEASRYVPLFFAAVIVGENPGDFGVDSLPLSSF